MKKLSTILALVAFTMCGPESEKIPTDSDSWGEDEKLIEAMKELPEEDKKTMVRWMMRAALQKEFKGTPIPEDMTIGKALEEQREIDTAQKAEADAAAQVAAEVAAQQEKEQAKLREAVTVAVTSFGFSTGATEYSHDDGFVIEMGIKNPGAKTIIAAKGAIAITDTFGEAIKTINFDFDETIAPGATVVWNGSMDYNQFMNEDAKLRSADATKLKFLWKPAAIAFDDGTTLTVE